MADDQASSRLVLWDIDHTLIDTGGVGSELARAAFEEITGRTMQHQADATGKTERAIIAETLRLHGIEPTDDYQQAYAEALAAQYKTHVKQLTQRGRTLPGAVEVLAALAEVSSLVQTVLSGNYRSVSAIKLEAFSLAHYLDLDVGAYGEDDADRSSLVPLAQRRAGIAYGQQFDRRNSVIVGDTPADIQAAERGGAEVVAVSTGRDTYEELRAAGAAIVLTNLTDTDLTISAIRRTNNHTAN